MPGIGYQTSLSWTMEPNSHLMHSETSQKIECSYEMISPGNSQANGTVEATVKIVKCLMRKYKALGEDLLLGLLSLCNTQTKGLNMSPAQKLLGRHTKSMVLMAENLLKPSYPYSYEEAQKKEGRKLKQQGTDRELSQLHIGDNV